MDNTQKADLARHMLKGNRTAQTYDYTEIEDRIRLKLDTLLDRLKHLSSSELEQVESGLDAAVRLIELFRSRHRPVPDGPRIAERPEPTDTGHVRRTAPDGQGEPFDGTQTTPLPIKVKIGLGVMCEFDDEAPEPEGTVIFNKWPKVGDEIVLPSDGKVWIITKIKEHDSYPVVVRRRGLP